MQNQLPNHLSGATKIIFVIALCCISLLTTSASAQSQKITVKGVVTTSSNTPIVGASVVDKATNTGTTTNNKGEFSLSVTKSTLLTVSFIGYTTQEIAVNSRSAINIKLLETATDIDNVVVIGYGSQNKEQITSSITQVKVDNRSMKNVISPLEALKGQVAGLTVLRPNGGDVTGDVQIMLRGVSTLAGGQGPLVVVDGIVGANINNVIMEEVESISVLKDGSAAAIYGTRATNGVIIITTKKQRSGNSSVEFGSYISVQSVAKKLENLSASEFRDQIKVKFGDEAKLYDYGADTDWFDEVTRTPVDQYYNLSFSAGTDKLNYRAAVNYKGSEGLVQKNYNNVLRGSVTVNQKALNNKLELSYAATYSTTKKGYTDTNVLHQAFQRNPTEPVVDPENTQYGGWYNNPAMLTYFNPAAMINEGSNESDWQYLTGTIKAKYNITNGLSASAAGSYMSNTWRNNSYSTRYYPYGMGTNGTASITSHQNLTQQLDLDLSYNKSFGKHNIDAIAGYSYYYNVDEQLAGSNSNFDTDFFKYNNIGAGYWLKEGLATLNSWKEDNKLIAFFGRVNYNFDSKYLISVSMRHEGSSRFGANNKWGWFPAASLGWRIDKENFMEGAIKSLSILKLRAGVGVTGNQDIGNYSSMALLSNAGGLMYYNGKWINTYAPSSNPNPNLKWEKKTEWNFGLDYGFFENRLSGSIDYYVRNTDNLLWTYEVPVPPNLYNELFTNVGKMQSKGLEITVSGTPVQTKNITWNTSILFSRARNKLVSFSDSGRGFEMKYLQTGWISEDIQTWTHYITEGGALGDFYAKRYEGMDDDGNPKYFDKDENGEITDADREVVGNAYPKFQLSWNNTLYYKNFDIAINLRGSFGQDVLNIHRCYFDNFSYLGGKNTLKMALDNPTYKGGPDYSSRYVEDASYVKLDNLTLGYTFEFKTPFIKSARIYAQGQNLFTITNYKGIDPEVGLMGLSPGVDSYYYYPRTKVFTLGINLTF